MTQKAIVEERSYYTHDIANNLQATTIEEFLEKNETILKVNQIELGGIQATELIKGGETSDYMILATKNSHLYEIQVVNKDNKNKLTVEENKIISTFKFIDSDPITNKTACEHKGGRWGRFGLFDGEEECNLPTSDAGKLCVDSNECESACVAKNLILPDSEGVVGKYYDWTVLLLGTCLNYVENGRAEGALCVD